MCRVSYVSSQSELEVAKLMKLEEVVIGSAASGGRIRALLILVMLATSDIKISSDTLQAGWSTQTAAQRTGKGLLEALQMTTRRGWQRYETGRVLVF